MRVFNTLRLREYLMAVLSCCLGRSESDQTFQQSGMALGCDDLGQRCVAEYSPDDPIVCQEQVWRERLRSVDVSVHHTWMIKQCIAL